MVAVLKSPPLEALRIQVFNEAYILYEAIAGFVAGKIHQIQPIIDYIQAIETSAQVAELNGLQEICATIRQNLQNHKKIPLPESLYREIEQFPRCVMDYLYAPTVEENCYKLINCLRNQAWSLPLTELQANKIIQSLTKDFKKSAPTAKPTYTDEDFDEEIIDTVNLDIPIHEPTPLSLKKETHYLDVSAEKWVDEETFGEFAEISTASETTITPSNGDLSEKITQLRADKSLETKDEQPLDETTVKDNVDKNEAISKNLETTPFIFTKLFDKVKEITPTLDISLKQIITTATDSDAFLENIERYTNAVQLLWEIVEEYELEALEEVFIFLSDNIFELSIKSQEERLILQGLFRQLPRILLNYLQAPGKNNTLLIEYLQDSHWPLPLDEDRINSFRTQLAQGIVAASQISANQLEPNETEMAFEGVNKANDNVQPDEGFTDSEEENLEPSSAIAEEAIIDSDSDEAVENEDDTAVVEVPIDFEEEDLELSLTIDEATDEFETFSESNFDEVVENEDDTVAVETPTDFEGDIDLSSDNDFEKEDLESSLVEEAIIKEADDEFEISSKDTFDKEYATLASQEATTIHQETALITETQTALHLADTDTLNYLDLELSEVGEQLSAILSRLASTQDGSLALREATKQYKQLVQTLSSTMEELGLEGLVQVCAFINQNLSELGIQEKTVRQASQAHLGAWPDLVRSYLHDPLRGAQDLVNYLCVPKWNSPLEPSQTHQLLASLTQGILGTAPTDFTSDEHSPDSTVSDAIQQLISHLRTMKESLTTIFDELLQAEEGGEALLTAIERYTEQVQAIWEMLASADVSGLQNVCSFINDNMMGLSAQDKGTYISVKPLFIGWIQFIINYLEAPDTELKILVEYLQSSEWPLPLDATGAKTLTQQLTQQDLTAEIQASETVELVITEFMMATETLAGILDTLMEAEDNSVTLLSIIETYTEQVQALWETADIANLQGLKTICTFISDNITNFGFQNITTRANLRDLFAIWPQEVIAYLQQPEVCTPDLLEYLKDTQWLVPLDEAQIKTLHQQLSTLTSTPSAEETPDLTTDVDEPIQLTTPEFLELVSNQIIDVAEGLSETLEEYVTMSQENPALLETIEIYTQQVQTISEAAEMAGLNGLQTVCTFINDNLVALGTQAPTDKELAHPYFEQWPSVVLEYLQAPLSGAQSLITLLQNPTWPIPLEVDKASQLLALLVQSSTATEQIEAYEAELEELDTEDLAEDATLEELDDLFQAETTSTEPEDATLETTDTTVEEADLAVDEAEDIALGSAEVLEILTAELESNKDDLITELKRFLTLTNNNSDFVEAVENYTDGVQRLQAVTDMLGLEGLQAVCAFIIENVNTLAQQDLPTREKAKNLLSDWPDLVLAYLRAPNTSVVPLINHLRENAWAHPLSDESAHSLLNQLVQGTTVEEEEVDETPARQISATLEDVLITIPEDINQELLDAYLQETPQHAADFSQCLQNIIQAPEATEIERAQRIAHTLKGSSNIIGIKGIANIAHPLEDILEYLAQHKVSPPPALTDTMIEAADCLEMMVDALLGQGDVPSQAQQVLQSVLDWANQVDKGNLEAPPAPERPKTEQPVEQVAKPVQSTTTATPEQVLKVPTRTIDNLMRLVGELSISMGQIQERLKHVLSVTRVLNEENLVLQQKTFELENLVDVRGVTGLQNQAQAEMHDENFDPLEFEEYNELHSVAHSFIETIADARELGLSIRQDLSELEGMFIHQERLNKEFENSIMSTRMVPVANIVSKLQRNVRQTCRTTGKQAELEISGADILIDSDVLNNLGDPLMHILRNSLSHGIETSEERVAVGKPEIGKIQVDFYHEGNNIVVKCQDDGQGLNYTNIRRTAAERGLIQPGQELTETDLARLILLPGFSTKSVVDQVAGRGVGMDVVHTNIRQMKGTLDLISETGKGITILIKLPTTLVTVHVLLVRVGQRLFGIPTNHLEQALAAGVANFYQVGQEVTLKVAKNVYAIKALGDLLNVPADRPGIEDYQERPIILAHEETGTVAVIIDELVDSRDLVMKTMGRYVKKIRGVAGASILGDGSLVPLLDLPELLRSPMHAALAAGSSMRDTEPTTAQVPPKVMIVDDSLSVRKSLSLLMEESGFETMLAKDGLEAIEMMGQSQLPNVMLVDMEMPRMNGLELTAHVRGSPATRDIPIFMITSRTTEKHREQAKIAGVSAYLTKPYLDTELLNLIDKALGR